MPPIRYILILVVTLLCLTQSDAYAQSYIIESEEAGREAFEVDSIFFERALTIVFPVNKTTIDANNAELQHFIRYAVPILHSDTARHARIRMRSAASPEGSYANNKRLGQGRRDALLRIMEEHGVLPTELQADVVDEEYKLLAFMMRQAQDPDAAWVSQQVSRNLGNPPVLKKILQNRDGGKLWSRLLKEYFPQLRATRFVIIFPENPIDTLKEEPIIEETKPIDLLHEEKDSLLIEPLDTVVLQAKDEREVRREIFAIKTNLLEWGAYVPQYGWCPIPNAEVEYYPRSGHWTLGGTFDCPWWIGNTTNHKYFELRNYQIYTRYYLRNSNRSYMDQNLTVPAQGEAAYRGLYLQAYGQAFLYQIGFSATKGWIGEGAGGGLGLGYVLPLSRDGHWRLDFGIQLGVFVTKYDPFVYGCPVENVKDGLYYYDYVGDADQFKKRQYSLTWMGPTRVGVSISYDLWYRKNHRKGISLHKTEEPWNR